MVSLPDRGLSSDEDFRPAGVVFVPPGTGRLCFSPPPNAADDSLATATIWSTKLTG